MYDRLENALSRLLGGEAPIKGTLGYSVNGVYRVIVAENPAKYYVRLADAGGFAQVYHQGRVAPVPDLPVEVGFDSAGNMVILGGDPQQAGMFGGQYQVGPHSHARGSGMEFPIDYRLLQQVKAAPVGGLTVEAAQGAYFAGGALRWWPGGSITLTPPGGANLWAWVLIGIDPAAQTLVSASGTAIAVSAPLDGSMIPAISFAGYLPLAAVRVRHGQTELDEADFEDLRYPLGVQSSGGALDDLTDVDTTGVSDGDLLTYASGTWIAQAPSGGGGSSGDFVVLYEETLASDGQFDVDLTGITGGTSYEHLEIRLMLRSTASGTAGDVPYLFWNNDTTSGHYQYGSWYAGTGGSGNETSSIPRVGFMPTAGHSATDWAYLIIRVSNYGNSQRKQVLMDATVYLDSSAYRYEGFHDWNGTTAITRVTVRPDGYSTDKLKAGSKITMIGING